ncbi:hypothetical protein FQZ97_785920 [compost metagenome]
MQFDLGVDGFLRHLRRRRLGGLRLRHLGDALALHADLLEVLLVGLGVGVDVLTRAAVHRRHQRVGFLQAADDLGEALLPFGFGHLAGLVRRLQPGEFALVAILRRLCVGDAAVHVADAVVDVGPIGGDARVVVADLLLPLGVVADRASDQRARGRADQGVAPGMVAAGQGAGEAAQQAAGDGAGGHGFLHGGIGVAQVADGFVAARVVLRPGGGRHLGARAAADRGAPAEEQGGADRTDG